MNLTELKSRPVPQLVDMARSLGLDNLARSRKQEVIAAILRKHAKNGDDDADDLADLRDSLLGHLWPLPPLRFATVPRRRRCFPLPRE